MEWGLSLEACFSLLSLGSRMLWGLIRLLHSTSQSHG